MPSGEFIGVINATRPKYMKGASDLTLRQRLLLAMLRRKGRIVYNASGDELRWQVEFSAPSIESYGDGGTFDFANHDAFRQLAIDWRGYKGTDSISKKQALMNSGDEALIKLFSTKNERIRKQLNAVFAGEMYKDGSASGRENCIHGLETFLGAGACAAGDRVAQPSDTYGLGALSTALGNQGGTWSSALSTKPNATIAHDWPDGSSSTPEYDFLSPKLINWSSTNWGTGSSTAWEDNCWRVISQAITWLTTTGGEDGMPDICVLAPNLFQGYKNHQEVIRRIDVPFSIASDLGFKGNTLNQDGVAISSDFDCPSNTGYMLNLSMMTLYSLWSELFWMEGPDKDPRSGYATLWAMGFFGNVTYQPKHVAKLFPYA